MVNDLLLIGVNGYHFSAHDELFVERLIAFEPLLKVGIGQITRHAFASPVLVRRFVGGFGYLVGGEDDIDSILDDTSGGASKKRYFLSAFTGWKPCVEPS